MTATPSTMPGQLQPRLTATSLAMAGAPATSSSTIARAMATYCNENGNRVTDGYKFKNASDNYNCRSYIYGYASDT